MRIKDDRLLPAYNVMIGTENQFILNYSIYQKSSETDFFIDHMENMRVLPKSVTGDSAFGSEENYQYLKAKKIKNFLKYNSFNMESKRTFKKKIFRKENFSYDQSNNIYKCPDNRDLVFKDFKIDKNINGYLSSSRVYQSLDCSLCQFSEQCKRGNSNRTIQVNTRYERFKAQARDNLNSEEGLKQRKRRGVEVESVFGNIKHNYQFRRFNLRSLDKVNIEFALIAIAHNIRKIFRVNTLYQYSFKLKLLSLYLKYIFYHKFIQKKRLNKIFTFWTAPNVISLNYSFFSSVFEASLAFLLRSLALPISLSASNILVLSLISCSLPIISIVVGSLDFVFFILITALVRTISILRFLDRFSTEVLGTRGLVSP
ncbi:hypothetical protein EON78_00825 [bacterium]|nr:MAG: hypothetical protein EON78_00825 [bacterium]